MSIFVGPGVTATIKQYIKKDVIFMRKLLSVFTHVTIHLKFKRHIVYYCRYDTSTASAIGKRLI
ncbi:hypothetical protein D3C77_735620 [compost metagenome]